jgi:hypothetical protein
VSWLIGKVGAITAGMRALPTSPPTTLGNGLAPAGSTTALRDISGLDGLPAEAQALARTTKLRWIALSAA